ncbi:MAG: hypothetical protein ABI550_09230 [Ignavibacteriaceae bacterium]
MKTFLAILSVALIIIFFGSVIFDFGGFLSKNNKNSSSNSSSKNKLTDLENILFVSNSNRNKLLSIKQIDSLSALENLSFTKQKALKLIVKL